MSFCLNPECAIPQNLEGADLCAHCGSILLLRQRYRAIAPLGQGGFGRTFLAIDEKKKGQPRCVIKQCLPLSQTPRHLTKAKALFKAEAARLKELGHHPQIPALLASIHQGQHQYLVQEFIDGPTLEQELQSHGAYTEAQVGWVLASLLPVLEFIHSQDVIHRDIKPANIVRWTQARQPPAASPRGQAAGGKAKTASRPEPSPQSAFAPTLTAPQPIDWVELLQALSREAAHGFRDGAIAAERFSLGLASRLARVTRSIGIADYSRCQQLVDQFAAYETLTAAQRQYLVADASRTLYELRRRYDLSLPASAASTASPGGPTVSSATSTPPTHLVLVDFGAAKAVQPQALSQTGTIIGSPEYLAPEQALGKAVYASDLYSLGVTCLHLLTQTSPLDLFDSDHHAWNWRHYLKQPISQALARILDKLVNPALKRRYASASAVLHDLSVHAPAFLAPPVVLPPAPILATPLPPSSSVVPGSTPSPPLHPLVWHCAHRLHHGGRLWAIALSPTAPILASSSGTSLRLWDLQAGQPMGTLTGHLDIIPTLAMSPDGQVLVSGSADKTLRLWELPTGKCLGSLNLHGQTVLAVAISPDGKWVASSSMADPIILWDLTTGQEHQRLFGHDTRVDALVFSADGRLLISGGGDGLLRTWTVETGAVVKVLAGHTGRIATLALSRDGKTLASGSTQGEIKLWSVLSRRLKRSLPPSAYPIHALTFSPGQKALFAGGETLQVWTPRNGQHLEVHLEGLPQAAPLGAVVMSPFSLKADKRQTLVTAHLDGQIHVWQGPKI